MTTISVPKAGATVAIAIGLVHLCWRLLVASGWAKVLVDFVLRLHFIKLAVAIEPFQLPTAALLVLLTTGLGFVVGSVLAALWNTVGARR
jgi:hypothetical protein